MSTVKTTAQTFEESIVQTIGTQALTILKQQAQIQALQAELAQAKQEAKREWPVGVGTK